MRARRYSLTQYQRIAPDCDIFTRYKYSVPNPESLRALGPGFVQSLKRAPVYEQLILIERLRIVNKGSIEGYSFSRSRDGERRRKRRV